MRLLFYSIFLCCFFFCNAQLSPSDAISDPEPVVLNEGRLVAFYTNGNKQFEGYKVREKLDGQWTSWYSNGRALDSGSFKKGIPDGLWMTNYKTGEPQFLRTYSFDRWQQFQNEKGRYHPKRVSMPLTELYHTNKKQAQKYTTAVNTFCAVQNCNRAKEDMRHTINNNAAQQHYHPIFENGLLHGPFANYFPGGAIKDSGNYKNGLPEGMWVKWTDDKKFYWEGHYHHGLKNKEWKLYAANAKLISIVSFREGKFLWRKDMKEGVEIAEEELSGF